jgi:hypothetical protein
MEGLRLAEDTAGARAVPCERCGAAGSPWDRIAGRPLCPDCQESLALGQAPPLVERPEARPCAACGRVGSLPYLTYPLHAAAPVEIDLCGGHFQALLGRRLDPAAFHRLADQLRALGVAARQVFLLHEAFYDGRGRPLQPAPDPW